MLGNSRVYNINASENSILRDKHFCLTHSHPAHNMPHNMSNGHHTKDTIANRNIMLDSIFIIQLRKYEIQPSITHGSCIIESNNIIIFIIFIFRLLFNTHFKS